MRIAAAGALAITLLSLAPSTVLAEVSGGLQNLTTGTDRYSHSVQLAGDGSAAVFVSRTSTIGDITYEPGIDRVYWVDLATGSVKSPGSGRTTSPRITADGRGVAFVTSDPLIESDTNGRGDTYFWEPESGALEVLVGIPTAIGNIPAMSDDGTRFGFVGPDGPAIYDRQSLAVESAGLEVSGGIQNVAISGDGTAVAFTSFASDLVPNDTNRASDVFLWELGSNQVTMPSAGFTTATSPSLGRTADQLAFQGTRTNGTTAIFAKLPDVGLLAVGPATTGAFADVQISSNGEAVVYAGSSGVPGILFRSIIHWSASDGQRTILTGAGNGRSTLPSVSADGSRVAFLTKATNLTGDDTNGDRDDIILWTQSGKFTAPPEPAPPLDNRPPFASDPFVCDSTGPNAHQVSRIEIDPVNIQWIEIGTDWVCFDGAVEPCPVDTFTIESDDLGISIRCVNQVDNFCPTPDGRWFRSGTFTNHVGTGGAWGFDYYSSYAEPIPTPAEAGSLPELTRLPGFNSTNADTLRLYRAFFNREPDLSGAKYWMGVQADGANLDDIATQFALSQEFQNSYGTVTNELFLTIVYRNVLGRAGDPEGVAYWRDLLDNGLSRGSAVRWIAAGAEFERAFPYPRDHSRDFALWLEGAKADGTCLS